MGAVTEWVVKLEAKSGWGEVETTEVVRLKRPVVGLTAGEVGLMLAAASIAAWSSGCVALMLNQRLAK
jgi:hypothetical protein